MIEQLKLNSISSMYKTIHVLDTIGTYVCSVHTYVQYVHMYVQYVCMYSMYICTVRT